MKSVMIIICGMVCCLCHGNYDYKGECVMKNVIYLVILFMQAPILQATWIIVSLDNQSDLKLLQAVRNNDVEIPSISRLFQSTDNLHNATIHLDPELYFGSLGGCRIIAEMPSGKKLSLAFFGDPTNKVANGRAQYTDVDSRNAATPWKQDRMARVMMMQDNRFKLVGFVGYQALNQKMNVKITGSHGAYAVTITLV